MPLLHAFLRNPHPHSAEGPSHPTETFLTHVCIRGAQVGSVVGAVVGGVRGRSLRAAWRASTPGAVRASAPARRGAAV